MKRTKFDQFSFCDIDDKELFLIHSVIMYETTNDKQKRNRIIAKFTSSYNDYAYDSLRRYNAEMAEHYLNYWYEKRYGTKLFAETEEVETEEVEKEKIDEQVQHAENTTTWTLIGMGIIIFIGIIITAICGGSK